MVEQQCMWVLRGSPDRSRNKMGSLNRVVYYRQYHVITPLVQLTALKQNCWWGSVKIELATIRFTFVWYVLDRFPYSKYSTYYHTKLIYKRSYSHPWTTLVFSPLKTFFLLRVSEVIHFPSCSVPSRLTIRTKWDSSTTCSPYTPVSHKYTCSPRYLFFFFFFK